MPKTYPESNISFQALGQRLGISLATAFQTIRMSRSIRTGRMSSKSA